MNRLQPQPVDLTLAFSLAPDSRVEAEIPHGDEAAPRIADLERENAEVRLQLKQVRRQQALRN